MDQKEIAMNGAGVAELGFPMWPQFDPKTKQDTADAGIEYLVRGYQHLLVLLLDRQEGHGV